MNRPQGMPDRTREMVRDSGVDRNILTGEDTCTAFTANAMAKRTLGFPTDALPGTVARLVEEAAAAIGCPPDAIGLAALTTLGSAIGNSRVIRPKKGWTEGAAIYAAVIADSGEKKSAAIAVATGPSQKLQNRLNKEHEKKLDEFAREQREYEVERKEAAKQGEAAPPPPRRPVAERVHVNDTTTEALIAILKENPRALLQERDELVGWVKAFDQYKGGGKGADRQVYLSLWSNRSIAVDRKGQQEPLAVLRPFVSVIGSIQPGVLRDLAEGREDGMLERFLFTYPNPINAMWTDEEITDVALAAYEELHEKLRDLTMEEDELADPIQTPVAFAPDAKSLFVKAYNGHRAEMALPGFPSNLRSPWAKLEGYFARLILILACSRFVAEDAQERIEAEDVRDAVRLVEYFKAQARRVFGVLCGFDPAARLIEDAARFVVGKGDSWSGTPTELHGQLISDFKHERPDDLSKFLLNRPEFKYEVRHKAATKDDGTQTTVRYLKLSLNSGVNAVNGVAPDETRHAGVVEESEEEEF